MIRYVASMCSLSLNTEFNIVLLKCVFVFENQIQILVRLSLLMCVSVLINLILLPENTAKIASIFTKEKTVVKQAG